MQRTIIVLGGIIGIGIVAGGAYWYIRPLLHVTTSMPLSPQTSTTTASSTNPSAISQILELTDTLVATQQGSNTPSVQKTRIKRLELISDHRPEVEQYLIGDLASSPSSTYPFMHDLSSENLLADYLLTSPNIWPSVTGSEKASVLDSIKDIQDGTSTDPETNSYEIDQLFESVEVIPPFVNVSTKTGFVVVADMMDSGAYNIFEEPYGIDMNGGHITVTQLPRISLDQHNPKKLTIESDDAGSFTNVNYSTSTNEVLEYGMLPFGLYPCNSVDYYAVLPDRLVFEREEEPVVCIGKTINGPDDLDKYFTDSTDFSKKKIVLRMPADLDKQARTMTLGTSTIQ